MQRKFLGSFLFIAAILFVFTWSCTKIDTTTLGADLIPAIDNVNTFETILNINGTQGFFTDSDSLTRAENHLLGSITNDPIFGKTNADIFLELKPGFFPYYFGAAADTINPVLDAATGFDSAYICLSVKGFYGDSLKPQHITVYKLNENTSNFKDSAYKLNYVPDQPYNSSTPIGQITILPTPAALTTLQYFNVTSSHKDSSINQIRIKITDPSFFNDLTGNTDTISGTSLYRSDASFKTKFKGFAIESDKNGTGNGLFYINISEANTRLEVYYHSSKKDTSFSAFTLHTSASLSITNTAHANHVQRDFVTGSPEIASPQPDALYLLSAPGTYASLKIPGLDTFSTTNRIIHRAELIAEQIPGADPLLDKALAGPPSLYLDLKDTSTTNPKYITLFKDLNPTVSYDPYNSTPFLFFPSGGIDFAYFGGFRRDNYDVAERRIYYNFNVSRYIQDMVTNHIPNYEMRLYAPYNLHYYLSTFPFPNSSLYLGNGRVKIGNGNNANPNYRLRLRIVYSRI